MDLNAHGGITYSDGETGYPVESCLWWFGFDCAHCNDKEDYDKVREYNLETDEKLGWLIKMQSEYPTPGVIRTQEYVEQECRNLADQLSELE